MWLKFITALVNTTLEYSVDLSLDKKSFIATRILAINVHETSLQLQFCTRELRDPLHRRDCLSNGRGA